MTKRALFAVAGFFGLCVSLSAQQGLIPEQFRAYGTLEGPWVRTPSVTLEDQDRSSSQLPSDRCGRRRNFSRPTVGRSRKVTLPKICRAAGTHWITGWIGGGQVVFNLGEKSDFFTGARAANTAARISRATSSARWGMRSSPSPPAISIRSRADVIRAGADNSAAVRARFEISANQNATRRQGRRRQPRKECG